MQNTHFFAAESILLLLKRSSGVWLFRIVSLYKFVHVLKCSCWMLFDSIHRKRRKEESCNSCLFLIHFQSFKIKFRFPILISSSMQSIQTQNLDPAILTTRWKRVNTRFIFILYITVWGASHLKALSFVAFSTLIHGIT